MSSSNPSPTYTRRSPNTRPASIAELADRARDNNWDDRPDLKSYLRLAERYRKTGKEFVAQGDNESAFVEFAKAATLVLEKLPTHRQYETLLTADQRRHLAEVRSLVIQLLFYISLYEIPSPGYCYRPPNNDS